MVAPFNFTFLSLLKCTKAYMCTCTVVYLSFLHSDTKAQLHVQCRVLSMHKIQCQRGKSVSRKIMICYYSSTISQH